MEAAAVKFTKPDIDALTCPPGRRDLVVFDDSLPGFGLRVGESGTKTFLLQYQIGGRDGLRRRLVLGVYGRDLTLAEARKQAQIARGKVRDGIDPVGERKARIAAAIAAEKQDEQVAAATAFTLRALIERWAAEGLANRSPVHQAEAPRAVRSGFAALLDQPAGAIDAAAVRPVLDAMAAERPVAARRTRDYARAAFNWAIGRERVTMNPFATVKLDVRETSRDRVLSDAELGEAWRAAKTTVYSFGPLVQLLILTLQRRGEVAGTRWSELAPDLSMWTIPGRRTKNRKEHIVHLAEPAQAVLRVLRAQAPSSAGGTGRHAPVRAAKDLVFTTDGTHPVSGFSNAVDALRQVIVAQRRQTLKAPAVLHAPDWTWHDFRRTGVTGLARLGVAVNVADRLLNHVQGSIKGTTAVYQRYDFMDERKRALDAWAAHVVSAAGSTGK